MVAIPTLREPLQNLDIYEAKNAFYVVGHNPETDTHHILHIKRGLRLQQKEGYAKLNNEANEECPSPEKNVTPTKGSSTPVESGESPVNPGTGFVGFFGSTFSTKDKTQQCSNVPGGGLFGNLGAATYFGSTIGIGEEESDQLQNDLALYQEPQSYSSAMLKERLKELQKQSPEGQFEFVCKAHGIVGFLKLISARLMVLITKRKKIGVILGHYIYSIQKTRIIDINKKFFLSKESRDEAKFRGLLNSLDLTKDFYFSYGYDLTNTLQSIATEGGMSEISSCPPPEGGVLQCNTMYAWNMYMMRPILTAKEDQIDQQNWTLPVIHGFFQQRLIRVGGESLRITLISRRSRHFAGTRYLRRGVDDLGHVANEVETEQIVSLDATVKDKLTRLASMVQIRGSIPLFWSHRNITSPKPDVVIYEKGLDATYQHFTRILSQYGEPCYVLNLIRQKEKRPIEMLLFDKFNLAIQELSVSEPTSSAFRKLPLNYICYDFITNTRELGANALDALDDISSTVFPDTGYFSHHACNADDPKTPALREVKEGQRCQVGVLRTNCVDCLDRTNIAQFCFGRTALKFMLQDLALSFDPITAAAVDRVFMEIFVENGDTLARQYGGSPSMHRLVSEANMELEGGQEVSVRGGVKNAVIATQRYISNNFMDEERQQAIDLFLGIKIPTSAPSLAEILQKTLLNQLPTKDQTAVDQGTALREARKRLITLEAEMVQEEEMEIKREAEKHAKWMLNECPLLRSIKFKVPRLSLWSGDMTRLTSFERISSYDFNIPCKLDDEELQLKEQPESSETEPLQAPPQFEDETESVELKNLLRIQSRKSTHSLYLGNRVQQVSRKSVPPVLKPSEIAQVEAPAYSMTSEADQKHAAVVAGSPKAQPAEKFYSSYINLEGILDKAVQLRKAPSKEAICEGELKLMPILSPSISPRNADVVNSVPFLGKDFYGPDVHLPDKSKYRAAYHCPEAKGAARQEFEPSRLSNLFTENSLKSPRAVAQSVDCYESFNRGELKKLSIKREHEFPQHVPKSPSSMAEETVFPFGVGKLIDRFRGKGIEEEGVYVGKADFEKETRLGAQLTAQQLSALEKIVGKAVEDAFKRIMQKNPQQEN